MRTEKHQVVFLANGRKARCTCSWEASCGDDTSDYARRRVIEAAESHAFYKRGSLDLGGLTTPSGGAA